MKKCGEGISTVPMSGLKLKNTANQPDFFQSQIQTKVYIVVSENPNTLPSQLQRTLGQEVVE